MNLINYIVTLTNSTGLKMYVGDTFLMAPRLGPTSSGSGTSADPTMYSYAFEFTEAEVTANNLPDLSSDKELTCYMNSVLIDSTQITENLDITTYAPFAPITAQIQTVSDDPAGDNTSGAINLLGNRAILTLVALFGLMTFY